jgi:hypothetical protein
MLNGSNEWTGLRNTVHRYYRCAGTRTERVQEALRDLTSPRALVIRDAERKRIAGREVVCGDLIADVASGMPSSRPRCWPGSARSGRI